MLEAAGVTDVYCCGLVFDICVKCTALHGADLGFKTAVIEDLCRPLDEENRETTKVNLGKAGVRVLQSAEAVAELAASNGAEMTLHDSVAMVGSQSGAAAVHDGLCLSSHASAR